MGGYPYDFLTSTVMRTVSSDQACISIYSGTDICFSCVVECCCVLGRIYADLFTSQ